MRMSYGNLERAIALSEHSKGVRKALDNPERRSDRLMGDSQFHLRGGNLRCPYFTFYPSTVLRRSRQGPEQNADTFSIPLTTITLHTTACPGCALRCRSMTSYPCVLALYHEIRSHTANAFADSVLPGPHLWRRLLFREWVILFATTTVSRRSQPQMQHLEIRERLEDGGLVSPGILLRSPPFARGWKQVPCASLVHLKSKRDS